jgi:hypothetical protein
VKVPQAAVATTTRPWQTWPSIGGWAMPGKIFINYRGKDTIATAGRLRNRLAQTFSRDNVFMDINRIPTGVDFVSHPNARVACCDVFLAVTP